MEPALPCASPGGALPCRGHLLSALHLSPGLSSLRRLGLVYFLYLFLFSGLEYTLSFLTHQRFQFSRWILIWGQPAVFQNAPASGMTPPKPHPQEALAATLALALPRVTLPG